MAKQMFVYIMTNKGNRVLYIGVTNDLSRRAYEHKHKVNNSFPARYNVNKLVYFEVFEDPLEAIAREKQLKGGSRQKKINLITRMNPQWIDLIEGKEEHCGDEATSLRGGCCSAAEACPPSSISLGRRAI